MPKIRKKISPAHYNRFKEEIETTIEVVEKEFDLLAKENGWKDGKSKMYAMMRNYISYQKAEPLEFEGD